MAVFSALTLRRVLAAFVVLGVLGLPAVAQVEAAAASGQPGDPARLGALPSSGAASGLVPAVPAGSFDGPNPGSDAKPTSKYDTSKAVPVSEVVGQRSARSDVWLNADGTHTLHGYADDKYFPSGNGGWAPIDNTLVSDPSRPGWVRNTANAMAVTFGPVASDGSGGMLASDGGDTISTGMCEIPSVRLTSMAKVDEVARPATRRIPNPGFRNGVPRSGLLWMRFVELAERM